jgi:hypothetical protein
MATFSFCPDMARAAALLLVHARDDASPNMPEEPGGHWSAYAPASIVLICTALDQWLNESVFSLDIRFSGIKEIAASLDTIPKYYEIIRRVAGVEQTVDTDLEMAWDVRNEIVHWLPRKASSTTTWPSWLGDLEARGLLLTAILPPGGEDAVDLASKLHSYALARWVWMTIETAVATLLASFPAEYEFERDHLAWTAESFSLFKRV